MAKNRHRSYVERLLEIEEMKEIRELIKDRRTSEKKEEKKEEKKHKFTVGQMVLIGVLAFPLSGPIVVAIWKISGLLITKLAEL